MANGDRKRLVSDAFQSALRGPWRENGPLLIPARLEPPPQPRQDAELDYIKTPITYREMFGVQPTRANFFDQLGAIGLQSLMASLSHMNSLLHVRGTLNAQDDLVAGTFDADLVQRIHQHVPDWRGRLVYSPQQLLTTMKAAVLHSPNREDERRDPVAYSRALAEVLLMANDILGEDGPQAVGPQGDLAGALLPHAVRSYGRISTNRTSSRSGVH